MRHLYLIFSHDHQEQLARLVRAIVHLSPRAHVAIHHDPTNAALDERLFHWCTDRVHVVPQPINGQWGSFALVEQYLYALQWCMNNIDLDWVYTLTGLSYPIKSLSEFEARVEREPFDAYVYHFDIFDPEHWPAGTGETRYLFRYWALPRFAHYYRIPSVVRNTLRRARIEFNQHQPCLRVVPMPRGAATRIGVRRVRLPIPNGFRLHGGRQMLNVNRQCLARIMTFVRENPSWVEYCKTVLIPDEVFFTSIVANDSSLRVCNDVMRHIKWPPGHAASVDVIRVDDMSHVLTSAAPFALKFDSRIDRAPLDMLDHILGIPESSAVPVDTQTFAIHHGLER